MAVGFFAPADPSNPNATLEELSRRQAYAEILRNQGLAAKPKNWHEGLVSGMGLLLGGIESKRLDKEQAGLRKGANEQLAKLLMGGQASAATPTEDGGFTSAATPPTDRPATFAGPSPASPAGAKAAAAGRVPDDAARNVYTLAVNSGMSPVQAAVFAGNVQQESSFNPSSINTGEGAHGLIQWRGPRWAQLQEFARKRGTRWDDPETQLRFFMWEATDGPPEQRGPGRAFLAARSPEEANQALKRFIRYGDDSYGTRLANARNFLGMPAGDAAAVPSQGAGATVPTAAAAPTGGLSPERRQAVVNMLLSGNPYAAQAVSPIIAQLMQQEMTPPEYGFAFNEGQAYRTNSRTGEMTPIGPRTIKRGNIEYRNHDNDVLVLQDGKVIDRIKGAGGSSGPFEGKSVDAQALNMLVKQGVLTPEQAALLGAGKFATGPNGELNFIMPNAIFPQGQTPTAPVPTQQFGNEPAPAAAPVEGQTPSPDTIPAAPAQQPPAPRSDATPQPGTQPVPATPPPATPEQRPGVQQITKGKPQGFTEVQGKAAGFATRMAQAENILSDLEKEGLSDWGRFYESLPTIVGNRFMSDEYQQFAQAKSNFITAVLRKESGALINDDEFARDDKKYFPQPGDSQATIDQKREARRSAIKSMADEAGPAYQPPPPPPADAVVIDGVTIRRKN